MLASLVAGGLQAAEVKSLSAARFLKKTPERSVRMKCSAREAARAVAVQYLPGKVVTSVWDEENEEWLGVAETAYVYNTNGTVATETEKDLEAEDGSLLRITYEYDDLAREISKVSEVSDADGEKWFPTEKKIREYDSVVTDFVTLLEIYSWNNDWSLMTGNRYLLDRDSNGLLTLLQRQVMYEGDYDTTAKIENGVSGDAVVSTSVSEMLSYEGQIYWVNNLDLRDIVWHNTNGQPMGFSIEDYSRGANRIASGKSYYADECEGEISGVYQNDFEGTFICDFYDESRMEIVTEYIDKETGSFRETYRIEYPMVDEFSGEEYMSDETEITEITYDDHGNVIKEYQCLSFDGYVEYAGGLMIEYEYDDKGSVVMETQSSYYSYEDEDGNMQQEVVPEIRMAMSDFVETGTVGVDSPAAEFTVAVRGGRLIVNSCGASDVEVYTLDGRRVISRSLNSSGAVSLDGIDKGVYIVKVSADSKTRTLKVTL